MNKLTKRLAAIGAAMTMAVSMMSMGASASKKSWKVTNANYNVNGNKTYSMTADGYNLYYIRCTKYNTLSTDYVKHYAYVTMKNPAGGTPLHVVVTDTYKIKSTDSSDKKYYFKSDSIPTYGSSFVARFVLCQKDSTTDRNETVSGTIKTKN